MNQILHCDWPPERARGRSSPLETTLHIPQEKFLQKPYNIPLLTKLVQSRWLDNLALFFFLLRVYGPRLCLSL